MCTNLEVSKSVPKRGAPVVRKMLGLTKTSHGVFVQCFDDLAAYTLITSLEDKLSIKKTKRKSSNPHGCSNFVFSLIEVVMNILKLLSIQMKLCQFSVISVRFRGFSNFHLQCLMFIALVLVILLFISGSSLCKIIKNTSHSFHK